MTTALVTGASGFIAKHIVRELLEQGYRVRASIRSEGARRQLEALFPDAGIEYVTLDLTDDSGWAEAMTGVDVLLHTASPFPAVAPKNRDELVRPAVDGTLRALRAAADAGVTRVILTSSVAAIYRDSSKPPMEASTRENWTDPDGPNTTDYDASKTLAERAAWDFVAEHPEIKLTVINPGVVFGTPLDEHYGTSLEYIERMVARKDPAYPNMAIPIIDVADVARMHVLAIDNTATFGQRFPGVSDTMFFVDIARVINDAHPRLRISTRTMPDGLVRVVALFAPIVAAAAKALGSNAAVDGSDAPRAMGFAYIPAREAILASADYLLARKG